MAARPLVVAIGGPSCSGKTSVCAQLASLRSWAFIHQDDFYKPIEQIPTIPGSGAADWDCPEGIDWVRMDQEMKLKSSEHCVCVVEGHMLSLRRDFQTTHFFYIDAPKEACAQRRATRSYDYEEPVDYFETTVWPCAQRTRSAAAALSNCVFLDGVSISDMASAILSAVETPSQSK
eukprot:m.244656 g.244656  ORF g.244656 m.244656 type:complete len:176 (+) comp32191_c0_seq1:70-597(+)